MSGAESVLANARRLGTQAPSPLQCVQPPAQVTDIVNEFEIRVGARVQEHLLAKGSLEAVSVEALCGSLPPAAPGCAAKCEELPGGCRAARGAVKRPVAGVKGGGGRRQRA